MSDSTSTVETETSTPAPASAEGSTVALSTVDDVSGRSSPASGETTAEPRESLLDVVRKAAPRREQTASDGEDGGPKAGVPPAPGAKSGEEIGPLTQAELESYRPRTRKRIEELLTENKGLRERLQPLTAQAQTTAQLQNFLKEADIAKEDFGLVLDLAAAMRKGDFKTFLEGVTPYVRLAQESLGISLPNDLAQAVKVGHMTQDAARYVAQERSARQLSDARVQRMTADNTIRVTHQQRQEFQTSVADAVTAWETGIRKSDPDYARKEPLTRDLLHAVVQERGPPRSPQEAVEVARGAYQRANAIVSGFNPTPRPTRQVPSSINRVNGARAEPKSLKEAIHLALERGR